MNATIVAVTEDNFEHEVVQAELPVLIDFWAPWCAPCRALAPTIDEVAEKYAGKIKVVKLNVDDAKALSVRYGVRSIPTLLMLRQGEVVDRPQGASRTRLFVMLEKYDV